MWKKFQLQRQFSRDFAVKLHYIFGSGVQRHYFEVRTTYVDDPFRLVNILPVYARKFQNELAYRNLRNYYRVEYSVRRVCQAALLHSSTTVRAVSEGYVEHGARIDELSVAVEFYIYRFDIVEVMD